MMVFEAPPVPLVSDTFGTIRVAGTRVQLETVIYAYQQGYTAEETVSQFPTLNLADVYGVITYYLNNRMEVDEYLSSQKQRADDLQQEIEARPAYQEFRTKILARRKMQ
jgi:uncharacterized protein (DUF433 family)